MTSIANLNANDYQFEPCSITWKGQEFSFWSKVLSAAEHRKVTDYFDKTGSLDLSKYREMADQMIAACVYVPSEALPDTKKQRIEFTDDDGDTHELVKWISPTEASGLKAALQQKIKSEVERVNRLTEEDQKELGKS